MIDPGPTRPAVAPTPPNQAAGVRDQKRFSIRVSAAEYDAIREASQAEGLTVAESARKRIVESLGLPFEPSKRGFANPAADPDAQRQARSRGGRNRRRTAS